MTRHASLVTIWGITLTAVYKTNGLTRKLLLELPDLHGGPVGGEADGVERHEGLEGAHHLRVVPVCRLRLVTERK